MAALEHCIIASMQVQKHRLRNMRDVNVQNYCISHYDNMATTVGKNKDQVVETTNIHRSTRLLLASKPLHPNMPAVVVN